MKKITKIGLMCLAVLTLAVSGNALARDYDLVNEYRREVSISDVRSEAQRSLTMDTLAAEYEACKTITDVHGNEVRMEQYIKRADLLPTQYKIFVLNYRGDLLTEGYSLKTFNKDLPEDLSDLRGKMSGIGGPPEYYMTEVETQVSNPTGDAWQHDLEGGHPVEIHTDGSCGIYYNEERISVSGSGSEEFTTKIKMERDGSNFYHIGTRKWYVPNAEGELAVLYDESTKKWDFTVLPGIEFYLDGSEAHWSEKLTFKDGTFLSHERYWINDDGEVLSWSKLAGEGLTQDNWQEEISKWNSEHILGASEFENNIDIVWSPHSLYLEVVKQDE